VEDQLIQQAQQGDNAAFEMLIDQHREAMFRYAYLIVRDAHTAEDVTQEAIWRLYKTLKCVDHTRAFRPWALHMTGNLARNQNRAWGRYKRMLMKVITTREERTSDVEASTEAQQQAAHLHEAVSLLKGEYQEVIYARFFMGLSLEESAVALGIAEGTVKSRAHRALAQLRALIEAQFPQLREAFPHD